MNIYFNQNKSHNNFLDYFSLFLLSAIWGSSFLFIKISVETIPPSLLTFLRLLVASIFLILYLKTFTNVIIFERKKFKQMIVVALLGNVIPFNLIAWSETNIDSVIAACLIGMMPIFTFIISNFFNYDERINYKIFFGLIISFFGMSILVISDSNLQNYSINLVSNFLVILAAISYALSANYVKQINDSSALQVATSSTVLATFISLPIFVIFNSGQITRFDIILDIISSKSLISCFILGFLCTGFAVVIFFRLIKNQGPGFASQSNFFIPVFGIIWSYMFLNENLTYQLYLSTILIVIGLFFVHYGRKLNQKL
mgnify:CR=1 FL=1